MNRPKRNEHNREKILETGQELFKQNGYHGTGLKQILDACQVPKGSFYNYFESKEQFAIEVLEYHHHQETEKWDQRIESQDGNILQKFRGSIELFIQEYEEDPEAGGCLLTNLMGEIGNASDSFRAIIELSSTRVINTITEDFRDAQEQGEIRQDLSPRAMAQLFWDSWQGALLRTKVEASPEPLRQVADTITLLFAPVVTPADPNGNNNED